MSERRDIQTVDARAVFHDEEQGHQTTHAPAGIAISQAFDWWQFQPNNVSSWRHWRIVCATFKPYTMYMFLLYANYASYYI